MQKLSHNDHIDLYRHLSFCAVGGFFGCYAVLIHSGVMGNAQTVNLLDADVVPHMGWDTIEAAPDSVLLNGVENERFYFVHSYAAMEVKPADTSRFDIDLSDSPERVSWCSYGRSRFVAAYEHGPLSATQFHPEKSGDAGSQLLKNWIATLQKSMKLPLTRELKLCISN